MKKTHQIELNISAERAWTAIGEKFGETGQWTTLLTSSHLVGKLAVGGKRVCLNKNQKITEVITAFNPEDMTFAYTAISGLPKMMKTGKNHWQVKSLGPNKSMVISTPTIELVWWAKFLSPPFIDGAEQIIQDRAAGIQTLGRNRRTSPAQESP